MFAIYTGISKSMRRVLRSSRDMRYLAGPAALGKQLEGRHDDKRAAS